MGDRLEACHEGVRRHDHLRPRPEVKRLERKSQGIEPARKAHAVRNLAIVGKRRLEGSHLRAVRERAGVDDLADLLEDLVLQGAVHGSQIEEGHGKRRRRRHPLTLVGQRRAV